MSEAILFDSRRWRADSMRLSETVAAALDLLGLLDNLNCLLLNWFDMDYYLDHSVAAVYRAMMPVYLEMHRVSPASAG